MYVPADIPESEKTIYTQNLHTLTKGTDNIFLLAGDQKIEHLHADFYGSHIHLDAADPEHLFKIAAGSNIGGFATHVGLIARYAKDYPKVSYIAKLNGKTNIIDTQSRLTQEVNSDPVSTLLWTVADVVALRQQSALNITGVGYTLYIGSEFEHVMLHEAAQTIFQAHQAGLVAVLWIYPRGKAIHQDNTVELLAGAAGVANALGADVVKIKAPESTTTLSAVEQLRIIKQAAGNTKVICAGGKKVDAEYFVHEIHRQIHEGNINGVAVGRNIFQRSLHEAITTANTIAKAVYRNIS